MYGQGYGVPEDDAEAVRWYQMAAEQGHAGAQYNLGYADGEGVPDDAEDVRWFQQGTCRSSGYSCMPRVMGCRKMMLKPCAGTKWPPSRDMPELNTISGSCMTKGDGVPEDDAEAVRWYQMAAEQGHAGAQYNLGVMYDQG